MNDKAVSSAREELLESRMRLERLGEKLSVLQKQVSLHSPGPPLMCELL